MCILHTKHNHSNMQSAAFEVSAQCDHRGKNTNKALTKIAKNFNEPNADYNGKFAL